MLLWDKIPGYCLTIVSDFYDRVFLQSRLMPLVCNWMSYYLEDSVPNLYLRAISDLV